MASQRGVVYRSKLPLTSSPDEMLVQTQEGDTMERVEETQDMDSVSSEESDSVLSQSQVNFPANLKREMARQKYVPAIDESSAIESSPSKNVSEWSVAEVKEWASCMFTNVSIAENFEKEEIDGKILLSTAVQNVQAMEQLGLDTIGKKGKFVEAIKELSAAGTKLEYPTVDNRLGGKPKGKLTLPDIKSLDPSTKQIYLAVRTRIRRAAEEEFPGDNIPTFRSNPEAKKRLENMVKQLSKTCSITEVDFGEEGIRAHVMSVLNERRRMVTLGHSYRNKRKSSSGDSSSDTEPRLKKSHDDDAASTSTSSCDHSDDVSEEGEIDGKSQFTFTFSFHMYYEILSFCSIRLVLFFQMSSHDC
ncbi:hypothetical protein OS493_000662 [Desmophyllum pertusum]|uniref:SAM domain-containing protein n=1 Tax=Desmophyllum pertusum TaxID=174260 RepID=A0A9X0DBV1_9CNID|nr:hypothetical protein OS493_000662 [Desmophyllum pertusum]